VVVTAAPRAQPERSAGPATADVVRAMFTRIASRYDLMNSLMTGGRHHAWRRLVARAVAAAPAGSVLDLATGTADLAIAIRHADAGRLVVGADFAEGMLAQARGKLHGRGERMIPLVAADAMTLPFPSRSFAAVTSAFLLRNLEDLERGLREMRRVTRPGGLVLTLDIVRPGAPVWGSLFGFYFHRVVPAIGSVVAGDRSAYTYLPNSVDRFVTPDQLARLMERVGFRDVTFRRLALGTIAIHTALA
jgi:demethylmenaquinone methyltransferase/2-methoxy-6-polyprenyl-1,4-benzoquinol methylase